jgi:hypothetical protein
MKGLMNSKFVESDEWGFAFGRTDCGCVLAVIVKEFPPIVVLDLVLFGVGLPDVPCVG